MAMLLAVSRLGDADTGGVPPAAALLTMAHRAHPGRLLGGFTITDDDIDMFHYVDAVVLSQRFGRVDLVHYGEELVGVACWVQHPALRRASACAPGPPPATTSLASDAPDHLRSLTGLGRPDRFDLPFKIFDLAFRVPDDSHLHPACLGTETGHDSRRIADLLLRDQHQRADRYGRALPLHIEAHSRTDRTWLHGLGYRHRGSYLSLPTEPTTYAMSRTREPRSDA